MEDKKRKLKYAECPLAYGIAAVISLFMVSVDFVC